MSTPDPNNSDPPSHALVAWDDLPESERCTLAFNAADAMLQLYLGGENSLLALLDQSYYSSDVRYLPEEKVRQCRDHLRETLEEMPLDDDAKFLRWRTGPYNSALRRQSSFDRVSLSVGETGVAMEC